MSGPVWGENEAISQSPDAISAEVARSAVETDAVAGADHHVSEPIPDTPAETWPPRIAARASPPPEYGM